MSKLIKWKSSIFEDLDSGWRTANSLGMDPSPIKVTGNLRFFEVASPGKFTTVAQETDGTGPVLEYVKRVKRTRKRRSSSKKNFGRAKEHELDRIRERRIDYIANLPPPPEHWGRHEGLFKAAKGLGWWVISYNDLHLPGGELAGPIATVVINRCSPHCPQGSKGQECSWRS